MRYPSFAWTLIAAGIASSAAAEQRGAPPSFQILQPNFTGQSIMSRRSLVLPGAGALPIGPNASPQPVTARDRIDDPPPIEVPPVIVHRKARRAFTLAPTWAQVPPATDRTRSRDPITGAAIGQFGGAYQDASPLRVSNPALKDPDLAGWWVAR